MYVSQRNAFTHLLIFGFFKVEYMYIHSLFAYIRKFYMYKDVI